MGRADEIFPQTRGLTGFGAIRYHSAGRLAGALAALASRLFTMKPQQEKN